MGHGQFARRCIDRFIGFPRPPDDDADRGGAGEKLFVEAFDAAEATIMEK